MEEQHISLKTAKLAKEKKFEEFIKGSITEYLTTKIDEEYSEADGPFGWKKGEIEISDSFFRNNDKNCDYSNENFTMYAHPTQSILQKWLREKHGLIMWVEFHETPVLTIKWSYNIHGGPKQFIGNSYEECMEMGLQKALECIKNE